MAFDLAGLRGLIRTAFAASILTAPMGCLAADAQAILAASDAVRNPSQPFRVTITMTEYENSQQVDTSTLISYTRSVDSGGRLASLVGFAQPARDAGKAMLKNGSELWFFDPGTKASVRISPQQRLMGQAANGDVMSVNFSRDYAAELVREEAIQDGERKQRRSLLLKLTAAVDDATYSAAEVWVDADSHAPLKAKFYADSGRLLKTAYYRRFQLQMGAERPTEMVIIDGLNPKAVTVVRFTEFRARNIPVSWFQRDYLPRFQPE